MQLCLKLTESELKSLLSKMAEWRDYDKSSNSVNNQNMELSTKNKEIIVWQKFSKGVCFYNLISSLASKLRSIFLPSMVSDILSYFILYFFVLLVHFLLNTESVGIYFFRFLLNDFFYNVLLISCFEDILCLFLIADSHFSFWKYI